MVDQYKDEASEAFSEGDLNGAVDSLKRGIKRDPYWEEGHRLLGDLYLFELNHPAYALVEYRKLRKVSEEFSPGDCLRLALAYSERNFDDRAAESIKDLSSDTLPDQIEYFDRSVDSLSKFKSLRQQLTKELEEQSEDMFEKFYRNGTEHKEFGNYFQAQKAFEKALSYGDSEDAKIELAECLIQRSKFPKAVRLLKEVLSNGDHPEARDHLNEVYSRLGITDFHEEGQDRDTSSDDSRKAS